MKKPFYNRPGMHREVLTFAQPFKKDGTPAVYTSILLFLFKEGCSTKKEILINGLGRTEALYANHWYKENPGCKAIPFSESTAGYLSSMFSDLHAAGLIKYWPSLRRWTIGDRYEEWKNWLRRA